RERRLTFPLTAAEQARHYADIRTRLMGFPKRIIVVKSQPQAPVETAAEVFEEPAIKPVLPNGVPLNMLAPPSWKFLRELAALRHGIGTREIMSHNRSRAVVAARYEAMALVYQHSQLSLPQVGRLFKRDHTTV